MNQSFSCPHCQYPASPARAAQTCSACRTTFALYAGAATDPSVVPPAPTPATQAIKGPLGERLHASVRDRGSARRRGGRARPVVARLALDKNGVAWHDVVSVTVWRRPDFVELAVAIIIPTPIALVSWLGVFADPLRSPRVAEAPLPRRAAPSRGPPDASIP